MKLELISTPQTRLVSEGDAGRLVRNSMVEALWVDCDNRAKVDLKLGRNKKGHTYFGQKNTTTLQADEMISGQP